MSEIRATTISDLAGTGPADLTDQWAPRAAFAFNQVTLTFTLTRNISSSTDTAAGEYDANYTNNFDQTNYCCIGSSDISGSSEYLWSAEGLASNNAGCVVAGVGGTRADRKSTAASIGDLA